MKSLIGALAAATGCLMTTPAFAAYTVTFQQIGPDVVATGTGSVDLSALTLYYPVSSVPKTIVEPTFGTVYLGSGSISEYRGLSGPTSFGSGYDFNSDLWTGNPIGVMGQTTVGFPLLVVPYGYVSGTDLGISTGTFDNSTFASMGLTTGTYAFSFGAGASADTFTVQIGDVLPALPEPATWAMMLLGFGAIGWTIRWQRGRPVRNLA